MDYLHMDQRNLNNAFAYDLVPSPSVITAALRAARRVNDYPTAVRIFEGNDPPPPSKNNFPFRPPPPISPPCPLFDSEIQHEVLETAVGVTLSTLTPTFFFFFLGIKAKVENQGQYEEYLDDLKPLREELGVNLKEDLYPEPAS